MLSLSSEVHSPARPSSLREEKEGGAAFKGSIELIKEVTQQTQLASRAASSKRSTAQGQRLQTNELEHRRLSEPLTMHIIQSIYGANAACYLKATALMPACQHMLGLCHQSSLLTSAASSQTSRMESFMPAARHAVLQGPVGAKPESQLTPVLFSMSYGAPISRGFAVRAWQSFACTHYARLSIGGGFKLGRTEGGPRHGCGWGSGSGHAHVHGSQQCTAAILLCPPAPQPPAPLRHIPTPTPLPLCRRSLRPCLVRQLPAATAASAARTRHRPLPLQPRAAGTSFSPRAMSRPTQVSLALHAALCAMHQALAHPRPSF